MTSLYNKRNASFDSIDQTIKQAVKGLSDQFRNYAIDWDGNQAKVLGTANHTVVCTRFVWEWMLFPLGLIIGVFVLLVTTIVGDMRNKESRLVWKTSTLPLLYYGLERRPEIGLMNESVLMEIAKAKAVFCLTEQGWRLRETEKKKDV
jgi:hypothetical protein